MPLHLLGKKSWNVYNKSNIERVRQDEREAELQQKEREREEGEKKLALLRGETLPPPAATVAEGGRKRSGDGKDERRKRRRLKGEDDTERDIRLARVDVEEKKEGEGNREPTGKNEKTKEEEQGMRFKDAAGYNVVGKPWYTSQPTETSASMLGAVEEKNLWGQADPNRKSREQNRIVSNDPFAVMQSAQKQLRQAGVDRERWKREKEREMSQLEREEKKRQRDTREDELEGFSLDVPEKRERRHHNRSKSSRHDGDSGRRRRSTSRQRRHDRHGSRER